MNDDDIFALPTPPPPENDNIFALPGDPISADISKPTETTPVSGDTGKREQYAKKIAEMSDMIKRQLDWHFGQLKEFPGDQKPPAPQVEAGEPETVPTPEPEPEPVPLPAPLKPIGGVPYQSPDPVTFTPTDDAVFTPDVKSPPPVSADIRTTPEPEPISADISKSTDATFTPTDDATFAPVVPDIFAAEPAQPPPLPGPQPQIVSSPPMPVNPPPRATEQATFTPVSPPRERQSSASIFQDIGRSMESLGLTMPAGAESTPGNYADAQSELLDEPLQRANAGGVHIEPSKPGGRLSLAGHMALGLHDALGFHRAYGISAPDGLRELGTAAKVASSWLGDKHTFGDRLRERMRMPTSVKSSTTSSAPISPATSSSAAPMTSTLVSPGMPESPAASFMPDWLPNGLPASALGSFDVGGMAGGAANPFSAGASPRTASGVGGSTFAATAAGQDNGELIRAIEKLCEKIDHLTDALGGDQSSVAANRRGSVHPQEDDSPADYGLKRIPFVVEMGRGQDTFRAQH